MNDMNRYREQLPAFIKGTLPEQEKQELRAAIEADSELQEEYLQLNRMYHGVGMIDDINEGHVDSETLAAYAEERDSLDTEIVDEIQQHLADCAECREELEICMAAVAEPTGGEQEFGPSWFQRLVGFLFPVSLRLRPVVVYSAVALLAVTTYLAFDRSPGQESQVARFEIVDIDQRGDGDVPLLAVDKSAKLVELNLALPTQENERYDFSLFDSDERLIMTWHSIPHNIPIAIEIPVNYLSPGRHLLRAIEGTDESREGSVGDTIETSFEVQFID